MHLQSLHVHFLSSIISISANELIKNFMPEKRRCWGDGDPVMEKYHDEEWGVKLKTDDEFFERLSLEMFQAGLSWKTILYRRESFRKAFKKFSVEKVSRFGKKDFQRLLKDRSIIRNRLKIESTIYNAKSILQIRKEFGSFRKWLSSIDTYDKNAYKEFQKRFKFMGPEIVRMFLMSTGNIPSHEKFCWKYKK